ncbi:MAG: autotransporter assembly complex protein TamA [Hoeflea sp.]|nr:autotransporter assembly complex family protein [Hoeflea sp.]MBU4530273.1 autotransporter assembly complex protein TamA [Alphaproteobacteria bacterium]MBU4545060.1 autotransporter assembly complex protein TamA [Alphaproteobacteria bacterium]MBU4549740.1 autotransporter assembly complex protein TamA [Alphaproteobacteria bacterium]MBV1721863.1 autotransporter assembly complex protein TamA [Hoeflea sp.]MBV1761213.1 autotransporter assembly complex protein TamA [Hoeflea sp.]
MRDAQDKTSEARGRVRLRSLSAVLALGLLVALPSSPAAAFEIFGFKLFESDEPTAIEIADPLSYTVTLDVEGPDPNGELKADLEAASQLVRAAEDPVPGSIGLIQRANSDFEQLVAALYENGRYAGEVRILLNGQPLADLAPDADLKSAEPVPVRILVMPGKAFRFGNIVIRDSAGETYVSSVQGLSTGELARSTVILDAERTLVRELERGGHPFAEVAGRDIVADHARGILDVALMLEPGPVAPFGETAVDGAESVNSAFIARMTGVPEGEQYTPESLAAAEKRLRALDVFSSVTVRGADSLSPDGTVPVQVTVSERKHRFLGIGATYSSTDGGGMEAYWGHRNLFGRAEKLRIEGSVGSLGATTEAKDMTWRGAVLFEKPGVLGPASKFTSRLEIAQENPDAFRRFSVEGAVGITYELTETQTVSAGIDVEYARLTDSFNVDRETITVALPLEYVRDTRDNELNPTTGTRLALLLEPAHEINAGATFVKLRAEASAYRALDDQKRFVVAGRVAAGSIYGADLAAIPANRRFYAGGGGSVRGYGYQDIGPVNAAGIPTGGRSVLETSAELRIGITETIGIVPFVDAGLVSASEDFSGSEFKLGAGLGLRYRTPFGPLRIDVAVPLNKGPLDPDYGIYAGIGQAF